MLLQDYVLVSAASVSSPSIRLGTSSALRLLFMELVVL